MLWLKSQMVVKTLKVYEIVGRWLPLHEAEKYKDDRVSFDKSQQM